MNSAKNSIRIVIPYFGKWPQWMPWLLASLAKNTCIDWLFYTDCGMPEGLPSGAAHIQFKEISWPNYAKRISDVLGINFLAANPYKLCDAKVANGHVHEMDLEGYDFFGFADIDAIYGNLDKFVSPILEDYDLLSCHLTRISGHFCLMRNNEKMRTAYQHIPEWKKLLENPKHLRVDEKHFTKLFQRGKNLPMPLKNFVTKMVCLPVKSYFHEAYSTPDGVIAWRDGSEMYPRKWVWEDGSLFAIENEEKVEMMYLHFFMWKRLWAEKNKVFKPWSGIEQGFTITPEGFFPL